MKHYHNRTRFKGSVSILQGKNGLSVLAAADQNNTDIFQDMQRAINKRRKTEMKRIQDGYQDSFYQSGMMTTCKSSARQQQEPIYVLSQSGTANSGAADLRLNFHYDETEGPSYLPSPKQQETGTTDDRSEESTDPIVDVEEIEEATWQMLRKSNVVRQPSIQARGPNQRRSIIYLLEKQKQIKK